MDKETITFLIQTYKQYETAFFNSNNLSKWVSVLDIRDSYLYGEVGFCLAGLKPSVLFDFPTELNQQYINSVAQPWIQQYSHLLGDYQLSPCLLSSPEIEQQMLVYFFIRLNDQRLASTPLLASINNNDHHHHHPSSPCSSSYSSSPHPPLSSFHVPTEDILATVLDYPGHLPKSYKELATMREVIYYDDNDNNEKRVLTTFACQIDEQQNVYHHFDHYKNTMISFGLKLKMLIRQPV